MTGSSPIDRRTPYDDLPEYLSPEEYQAYLGIGRTTVYDLLRRQEIPHLIVGRQKRIPKTALRPAGFEVK